MREDPPHDARARGHFRSVARRRYRGASPDHADAGRAAGQPGIAANTGLGAVADPDAALAIASALRRDHGARSSAGRDRADRSAEDAILSQRFAQPAARARPPRRQPRLGAVSQPPAAAPATEPVAALLLLLRLEPHPIRLDRSERCATRGKRLACGDRIEPQESEPQTVAARPHLAGFFAV